MGAVAWVAFAYGAALPAPVQEPAQTVPIQTAALQPRTVRFVLKPAALGHAIQIDVTAPPMPTPADAKLPAIYVLDGGYDMIGQMAGFVMAGGEMAPAYVISIGYPNPNGSHIGERNTDLSHVRAPYLPGGPVYGGGGAAFEAFLLRELVPFVNARFPVDRKRAVLMGHSMGGLFATTVLAERPYAFAGYFIASPSIPYDPSLIGRAKAASVRGEGRRVYISVGGDEGAPMVPAAESLAAALSAPGSTFKVRQTTFAGEGHMSVLAPMLEPGLGFLLPP